MLSFLQKPWMGYLLLILISCAVSRSPAQLPSSPPTAAAPWADGPVALVATPQLQTHSRDIFTAGASHMALAHNAIFRAYNAIFHQAPHVRDADKADFVAYCLAWHAFIAGHHDHEEASLFPAVAALLDDLDVWAESLQEHEALHPGLQAFHDYLAGLPTPRAFSGARLRAVMAGFQDVFATHFHREIATIAALAAHPRAPVPGSPQEAAAAAVFKAFGRGSVQAGGPTAAALPLFLLNHDVTFEAGAWAAWPPMPRPVRWAMVNLVGIRHAGWWRFASCDAAGRPRQLYAGPGESAPFYNPAWTVGIPLAVFGVIHLLVRLRSSSY